MNANRFSTIDEARRAAKPKGSRWSVSFGPHEHYLGHIFLTSPTRYLLVTKRGNLVFYADEVIAIEWVDETSAERNERSYWPAEPYI